MGTAAPARAAQVRQGDAIVVGPGEVVDDDLYAFGGTVRVEGEVRGDVLAFCQKVVVTGKVGGDLVAAARTVDVEGAIGGSVRAAANKVTLNGKEIGRDVVVAGAEVSLGPGALIRKDLIAAGGKLRISSPVGGTVRAAANELVLDAPVGADVYARAQKLTVGPAAAVGGLLSYAASTPEISPQARIGKTEQLPAPARMPPAVAFLVGWVRLAVGLFVLGLVFRLVAPRWSRAALAALKTEPGRSVAWGAVALVVVPVAAAAFVALGALLGGWWVGLIVLFSLGIAIALAFPLIGMLAGEWIAQRAAKREARLGASLLVGAALLSLVLSVPILGAVIALATVLFGLGALLLGGWNLRHVPAVA
jgi:hypothetical protein